MNKKSKKQKIMPQAQKQPSAINKTEKKDSISFRWIFDKEPIPYVIIILLIFLVYFQAIGFGWTNHDDYGMIFGKFSFLSDLSNIKNAFLSDAYGLINKISLYRPLQTITFILDAQIGGANPWIYHLSNIIFHALASCLVYRLLITLNFQRSMSLILVAFWSVHHFFVHAVCWLPARGDLLLAVFSLLSMLFFLKMTNTGKIRYTVLNALTFLLALFSKETALVLPLLYFLYHLFFLKKRRILNFHYIILIVSYSIITLIYLYLRNLSIYSPGESVGVNQFLKNAQALPEYFAKFIFPVNFSVMPSFDIFAACFGIIFIILLFIYIYKGRKDILSKLTLFGFLWFLIFIIPGFLYRNALFDFSYGYLNHRAYLPSLGLMITLAGILQSKKFNEKSVFLPIAIAIILISGIACFHYSKYYKDPISYAEQAIKSNPSSGLAYFILANELYNSGNADGAIENFNKVVELFPKFPEIYANRSFVLTTLGRYREAIEDDNRALKDEPNDIRALKNRGLSYYFIGDHINAINDFSMALRLNPNDLDALFRRAIIFQKINNLNSAISDYNSILMLSPNNIQALFSRGLVLRNIGDFSSSQADFTTTIQLRPGDAALYLERGVSRDLYGDHLGAIDDFNAVIYMRGNPILAYRYMGNAFHALKQKTQACASWSKALELGDEESGRMMQMYCK